MSFTKLHGERRLFYVNKKILLRILTLTISSIVGIISTAIKPKAIFQVRIAVSRFGNILSIQTRPSTVLSMSAKSRDISKILTGNGNINQKLNPWNEHTPSRNWNVLRSTFTTQNSENVSQGIIKQSSGNPHGILTAKSEDISKIITGNGNINQKLNPWNEHTPNHTPSRNWNVLSSGFEIQNSGNKQQNITMSNQYGIANSQNLNGLGGGTRVIMRRDKNTGNMRLYRETDL